MRETDGDVARTRVPWRDVALWGLFVLAASGYTDPAQLFPDGAPLPGRWRQVFWCSGPVLAPVEAR